jgi:hypothetical protein
MRFRTWSQPQSQSRAGNHSAELHVLRGLFQEHLVRANFLDLGVHQHVEPAPGAGFLDALTVALLGALEGFAAIREHNRRIAEFRNTGRRLERAITAAHDDDLLAAILFGVDEPIHDYRQFFTGHAEFARRAAPADGQQHRGCRVGLSAGAHMKRAFLVLDAFHPLLIADLKPIVFAGISPEFQQRFLRGISKLHLADDGQLHRRGHHQLAARILKHGAPQRILFDGLVVEPQLLGSQRRGQTRRSCADDQDIEGARALHTCLGDRLERLLTLHQRILDQPHAAEFAGDVDAWHVGFEVRLQHRNIEATPLGPEHQRDRIERTDHLACTMSDAVGWTHEHCLAIDQAQHFVMRLLGAGFDACSAAQAFGRVDERMQ